MITLPNGDKWIIDDSELKGVDYENVAKKGLLPETSVEDFITALMSEEDHQRPRKFQPEVMGGYWDGNFSAEVEVLSGLAEKVITTDFNTVCKMADGRVYVVYVFCDGPGYDGHRIKLFPTVEDYNNAVIM